MRVHRFVVSCLILLAVVGCGGGGSSSSSPGAPPPTNTPPPSTPSAAELNEAAKLLSLATFGADYDEIVAAAELGSDAWLDAQFLEPPTLHAPIVVRYVNQYGFDIDADPNPGLYRRFAFYENAFTAPDQLRQLVAYALGQIFVVSDNVDQIFINPLALSTYYDTLLEQAFGNFRDLLLDVTMHPAMGLYLSHVNNGKSDPVANTFPDENYAREVMQLFTIGLFELNPDGTFVLDGDGAPIPTYDNADIREFSKIFTGLSYGPAEVGGESYFGNPYPVMHVPMVMFDAFHEPGEKVLLGGQVVPDGQTGMQDVEVAVDNLFNHPNVGPFIGKLLIQRLVTSNPSPEYVARVAAAFDGGPGEVRGEMARVVRAILRDPEAAAGLRLKEPFRRFLAVNKALDVQSDDGTFPGVGFVAQFLTEQHVLSAPSVFNFYLPVFSPSGELGDARLAAPEFQITTESTIIGNTQLVAYMLYGERSLDTPAGFAQITLDLAPYEALAADTDALLDRIDLVFFSGGMSPATRQAIADAVVGLEDPAQNVRLALYLALTSPDYVVEGGA